MLEFHDPYYSTLRNRSLTRLSNLGTADPRNGNGRTLEAARRDDGSDPTLCGSGPPRRLARSRPRIGSRRRLASAETVRFGSGRGYRFWRAAKAAKEPPRAI